MLDKSQLNTPTSSTVTTNRSRAVTTESKLPGSGEPHPGLQSTPIFSSHPNSQHATHTTHITTRPILNTKVSSFEAAQHPEHPCQTTHLSLQRQHGRAALARHEPETRVESWENHVSVSHPHRRTINTGQEHVKSPLTSKPHAHGNDASSRPHLANDPRKLLQHRSS
jgi:hypothetical protein